MILVSTKVYEKCGSVGVWKYGSVGIEISRSPKQEVEENG
jgi:hypothetical protein